MVVTDRLAVARRWINEYAPRPHPDLGRDGVVCPYMVRAVRRDYVTLHEFDAGRGDEALMDYARDLRDEMIRSGAALGPDRTYQVDVVVPHGRPEPELKAMIQRVHGALRAEFVLGGFVAGDFWPDHETVGLHSDGFRPFSSPVPMLGMRRMVPADLIFFVKHEPTPQSRLEYLRYYRRVFTGRLNEFWAERLDEEESVALRLVDQRTT